MSLRQEWERYSGRSMDDIVARWESADPAGFAKLKDGQKAFSACYLEGLQIEAQKSGGLGWSLSSEARKLFGSQGMLAEQIDLKYLKAQRAEALSSAERVTEAANLQSEIADLARRVETNTTSDIATISRSIAYVVTRMQFMSWVPQVINQIPMSAVSMHIGIEDMLTDDGAGHAYATGSTLWNNDDPDFGNQAACTDDAALIKMRIQNDTLVATSKLVGAKICVAAIKNARDLWGRDPLTALPETITWELWKEVYRGIVNTWLTSAGTQTNWPSTATGVYVTLDPRVYLMTLEDTVLDVCATIEGIHNQRPDWRAMTPGMYNRFTKMNRSAGGKTTMLTETPQQHAMAGMNAGAMWETGETIYRDLFMLPNKILVGISKFMTRGNAGQTPTILGVYPGSDRVEMLYTPTTTILEMAQLLQTAVKLLIASAYGTVTVT